MNLEALKIDALLVTNHYNKRYLTGFTGSTSEVIYGKKEKLFITDGRYKTQATKEVNKEFDILYATTQVNYFNKVVEVIKEYGFKTIGVESQEMSISYFEKLKKELPEVQFKLLENPFFEKRIVKNEEELKKIKEAVVITDKAFSNILEKIEENMTEKELAIIVDTEHSRAGGEYPSFDSIVAFGENTAKPHAKPGNKKLKKGDIITIDFGTFKNGYCSDMTRTFFFGKPENQKLIEIHNTVLEAMKLQIDAVKPGVSAAEIDAVGRDYISSKGYGEYFVHGTGHGIGLEIHEEPRIIQNRETILEKNMVFTIEPGIYIEGIGGVRIENDIIVTETGYESLNQAPREYNLFN